MTGSDDFAAQFAALREQYVNRLEKALDEIVSRVAGQGVDRLPAILAGLHADLHKLAGSGGTFGFSELSRQARSLEMVAKAWLEDGAMPDPLQWEAWKTELSALRRTIGSDNDSSTAQT